MLSCFDETFEIVLVRSGFEMLKIHFLFFEFEDVWCFKLTTFCWNNYAGTKKKNTTPIEGPNLQNKYTTMETCNNYEQKYHKAEARKERLSHGLCSL